MAPSRRGTGFTNLSTLLGLNQGSAARMGNDLASGVERDGANVAGAISAADMATREKIQQGTLSGPGTGPMTAAEAQQRGQQTYNGPYGMDANTYTGLAGRAAQVGNQAQALGNNTGRATLLAQKYGQSTWGGGQLDAALAGAGSAGGRMANASGAYGRLANTLGSTQASLQTAGRAAADASGKAAQQYADMVPGLQQQEQAGADAATTKAREDAERRRNTRETGARDMVARRNNRAGTSIMDNQYP